MRMVPPKPPPRFVVQYRVRFRVQGLTAHILDSDIATAHPGIMKGSRPKANRLLASIKRTHDAWLEMKQSEDNEWKRIEDA